MFRAFKFAPASIKSDAPVFLMASLIHGSLDIVNDQFVI